MTLVVVIVDGPGDARLVDSEDADTVAKGRLIATGSVGDMVAGTEIELPVKFVGEVVAHGDDA